MEGGYKIFVNNVNTYVGQALVNELRNDSQEEIPHNVIIGTLKDSEISITSPPNGVNKLIDKNNHKLFKRRLLECDLICYDLNDGDAEELEFSLRSIKHEQFKKDITYIIVSSIHTWGNTPKKERNPNNEEKDEEARELENLVAKKEEWLKERDEATANKKTELEEQQADTPGEVEPIIEAYLKDQNKNEPPEPKVERKYQEAYDESEFSMRTPLPNYENIKTLESLAMSLGSKKEGLKLYVVGAGLMYGNGEKLFQDHFKKSWLQNPESIPQIGSGENILPTVHVKDVAKLVKQIFITKDGEKQQYLAIDATLIKRSNKAATQKEILKSISIGLGTGKIHSLKSTEVLNESWSQSLQMELMLKPSSLMSLSNEDGTSNGFDWTSESGVESNISKVRDEFNKFRGLRPIKVILSGPPGGGKTFFAEKLAEHYNIEHITMDNLLKEFEENELNKPVQDGEENKQAELKLTIEKEKEVAIEAIQAKQKKKEPVDPSTVKVPYPIEGLTMAYTWKLRQNTSINRGYVLDNYPTNYDEAKALFTTKPQPKVDEETGEVIELDEYSKNIKIDDIFPSSVFILTSSDDNLMKRIKNHTEEQFKENDKSEESVKLALAKQKENNCNPTGNPSPVQHLFGEQGLDQLKFDTFTDDNDEIKDVDDKIFLERLRTNIEREGRPFNYLTTEEELEKERLKREKIKLDEVGEKEKIKKQKEDEIEKEQQLKREAQIKDRQNKILEDERETLDMKSLPLRNQLMDNVIPTLTEGLIETCKVLPDDPIDQLAEQLFKHSSEVKYPNPGMM